MTAHLEYTYSTRDVRVVFGIGSLATLDGELNALGVRRVLLVATPGRTTAVAVMRDLLGPRLGETFAGARQHVPVEVVRVALEAVHRVNADAIVSFGGGSAVGLGKALARETSLPLIAVPTTYAGSEMTSIWGTSEGGEKRTGRDPRVAPRLVLYDPELTLDLTASTSAASGMNAIAHCVEALYARDANPVSSLLAEDGLRRLAASLPRIVVVPADVDARSDALTGAHLAGRALDLTTMGLHHKLCHVLGGLGLPHAETHAALLPHVVAFNAPAAPEAMSRICAAIGAVSASDGLAALSEALGTRRPLSALGLQRADIPRAAALAAASSAQGNPRAATEDEVRALLERAMVLG